MIRDSLVLGCVAALLCACSSPGNEGSSSDGGTGGSGAAVNQAGSAGSNPSAGNSGVAASGTGGALSGASGSSGGVNGGAPSAGTGGMSSAGNGGAVSGGGASAGGAGGSSGSAGSAGSDGNSGIQCLPSGQEKLLIEITGQPSLDVTTPSTLSCLSRFIAAHDGEPAELSLVWNTSDGTISATLRQDDVAPGQTGMFDPFAVIISRFPDAWLAMPGKCHVTISSNEKTGVDQPPGAPASDIYKVSGSMACDAGWALGKATDTLDKFEFTTRAMFTGPVTP